MKKLLVLATLLAGCYATTLPKTNGIFITDSWTNNCPRYQGRHQCGDWRAVTVEVFNNTPSTAIKTVVCKYSSGHWFGSQTKSLIPFEQDHFLIHGFALPGKDPDNVTCLLQ